MNSLTTLGLKNVWRRNYHFYGLHFIGVHGVVFENLEVTKESFDISYSLAIVLISRRYEENI